MHRSESLTRYVLRAMGAEVRHLLARIRSERRGGGRTRTAPDLVVGTIEDPELAMMLMSVRGQLTMSTVDSLARALDQLDDDTILHLDVTDAEFADPAVFAHVERLMDELEDRNVRIRIVGLHLSVTAPSE